MLGAWSRGPGKCVRTCTPARAAINCLIGAGGTLRNNVRRSRPLASTPVKRVALELLRKSRWGTAQSHAVRTNLVETAPPACACGATTCTCVSTEMPIWQVSLMASAWTGPQVSTNAQDQVLPTRLNCQTCAGVMTLAPTARQTLPVDGVMKGLALVLVRSQLS